MDKKGNIIAVLAFLIVVLLGLGAYFFYNSIEQALDKTKSELDSTKNELNNTQKELDDTKKELTKSQEQNHGLNLQLTEVQKNLDDIKTQLDETKKNLSDAQKENQGLRAKLADAQTELGELKKRYGTVLQRVPAFSPVLFNTRAATPKKETGIAQGPSGQILDVTSYNDPEWTDGVKGRALEFNGENQYVSAGNILQGSYTNFSIACWVKHPSTAWQIIVERGEWDHPDGIGLIMDNSGQSVDFGHYSDFVKSNAIVQDDQWHHVVGTMTRDGENYIYSIYVDGKLDNTYTSSVGLDATANPWAIGGRYNGSWLYQGLIEDVHLYDRTLSADQVQELYYGG